MLHSLETGWLTSGPFAAQLEEEFAAYCGVEHAFAVSSCTTAMHLALVALGIGAGDEVLTTPLTWPATANVIVQTGAKPVFCDVDPVTLCIDPDEVAAPRDDADPRDHARPLRGPARARWTSCSRRPTCTASR